MQSVYHESLTPLHFLYLSAYAYPKRTAVIYGEDAYSYSELKDRVCRLATALKQNGINKDDKVAFLCPNIPPILEAHYGVPLLSAILLTINIRLAPREIVYILKDSGAKILFVDTELAPLIQPIMDEIKDIKIINICDKSEKVFDAPDYEEFINVVPDSFSFKVDDGYQPISLNYTSGTTGQPKGVLYHHRGAYLNSLGAVIEHQVNDRSKYVWTVPMFHCNGWCFSWAVTAVGGQHICLRQVDPKVIFALISAHQATHMSGVPSVLGGMADYASRNPVKMPENFTIVTGGAPPSPAIIKQMEKLGCNINQVYGLTETYAPHSTTVWKHEWDNLPDDERYQQMAKAGIPTVTATFMDVWDLDTMKPVPHDGETIGEVVMWGNNVMLGYHNLPEETEKAFKGGVFHSGDLAVVHPDGYTQIKDRLKDIIISGGENISSVEVENTIYEHPDVLEVGVVGIPHEKWQEVPKAYIKLKEGAQTTAEEIKEFCKERIARYKAPKEIEFGDLPKTATGKIQKNVLREKNKQSN